MTNSQIPSADTATDEYARRLESISLVGWKSKLRRVDPYGWNMRRLCTGRVLDIGSGIGRGLEYLRGAGVGIDHNPKSVAIARSRGLTAYIPEDFLKSDLAKPDTFDTLLVAHVLEHLEETDASDLLNTYLPYLRRPAKLVLICPQERGYASDDTHVRWVGAAELRNHIHGVGGSLVKVSSFPFLRSAGKLYIYNETVAVGTLS